MWRVAATPARHNGLRSAAAKRQAAAAVADALGAPRGSRGKRTASKAGATGTGDKSSALAMAIRQIESAFGKGAVMQLGSTKIADRVEVISTGSLSLDLALGVGGLPRGRVVEIYGPESSGKTTLALSCIAQAQKQHGVCAFIDAEHAIDAHYAKQLGVNIDDLYIAQPDSGEQALEIADTLVRSGAVDVVVVDSVAALVPRAELEGEMGDQQIALQARLMSQALRKLTGSLSKSNCMLIFLNQIRQKVGIIFGSPEVTSGGTALRYYASVRLDIRRKAAIKEGDKVVGNEIVVKVAKNKMASPFRTAHFDMMFGQGIDRYSELLDLGVQGGLVKRSGAWYTIAGREEPIAQGKAKAKLFLEANPEIANEIEAKLRTKLFAAPTDDVDETDAPVEPESPPSVEVTATDEVDEFERVPEGEQPDTLVAEVDDARP